MGGTVMALFWKRGSERADRPLEKMGALVF
jgi:hypothetical protein